MNSSPLVSIIVPLYNKGEYVQDCLESLLGQTVLSGGGDELEVIVVDDASTDGSVAVVEKWAARDGRIRLLRLPANAGPAAARNAGLDVARGKFVGFVDADDWVAPRMYEVLLGLLQETPGVACARCGQIVETAQGTSSSRAYVPHAGSVAGGAELYRQMFGRIAKPLLSVGNALFRRSVLDGLDVRFAPEMHNLEDVLFNARLFAADAEVVFAPDPLYHIRVVESSQSRLPGALRESYRALVGHVRELERSNVIAQANRRAFWVYRIVVLATLARKH